MRPSSIAGRKIPPKKTIRCSNGPRIISFTVELLLKGVKNYVTFIIILSIKRTYEVLNGQTGRLC